MKYHSTQGKREDPAVSISQAILEGIAPEGGLYVPKFFPAYCVNDFGTNLEKIAEKFLGTFFLNDPLEEHLPEICKDTFTFDIPLKPLDNGIEILELFHGPTAAFKDVGARFLANSIKHLNTKTTILVATSGDTGSAVAAAFNSIDNIQVVILYPKDRISITQKKLLTCWGENVISVEVNGSFDDCQSMVKKAFRDEEMVKEYHLNSANSINIGRLLPQAVYYVKASLEYFRKHKKYANFIIPTGNMGNSLSAIWAKLMGFPIGQIVLATNANDSIVQYFKENIYRANNTRETLATAMDVGNPSNMERFLNLKAFFNFDLSEISAQSVTDDEIRQSITQFYKEYKRAICPHTATAFAIQQKLGLEDVILVATAHPGKFPNTISDILGIDVPLEKDILDVMKKATDPHEISNYEELVNLLKNKL